MPMKKIILLSCLFAMASTFVVQAQQERPQWHIEWQGAVANGDNNAPLWLSSGNYGLSSNSVWHQYLLVGGTYTKQYDEHWSLAAGADVALTQGMSYKPLVIQQAYVDLNWRRWTLSVGSKKRNGSTLQKDQALSMGQMHEGDNILPIPQVRLSVEDYWPLHWVGDWISVKGHVAYGWFTDGGWQEDFVAVGKKYTQGVLYHSKSAGLRFGNADRFPLTLEVGISDFAQFGGKLYVKDLKGDRLEKQYGKGLKNYWKALLPLQESTEANVEGNHAGAWTAALTWKQAESWQLRAYLDHFFEDHSQLTLQYGLWKDGQLGLELTMLKHGLLDKVLIECMDTRDQTTAILYNGVSGTWKDIQWSGDDNYFNNGEFLAMHHWGMTMGSPLFAGPIYNEDHSIRFRSNRAKAYLLGLSGHLSESWGWMAKVSWVKHWGTHHAPFIEPQKQWSSKFGMNYHPQALPQWTFEAALGYDRGAYLGESLGGSLKVRYQL